MGLDSLTELSTTSVLWVILIGLLCLYLFSSNFRRKLPPGPYGLPVVGYLPFMTSKPHIQLGKLRKKYGPIFSLRIGRELVVVLSDFSWIKDAFNRDAFMGRPSSLEFLFTEETQKVGAFNNVAWKEQKRVILQQFRDLGFGKPHMENHIKEEVLELLEKFESQKGKPFNPYVYLSPSTSNNIASLLFGKRRKFDDPKRLLLDSLFKTIIRSIAFTGWLMIFPFLKFVAHFFRFGVGYELHTASQNMKQYIKEEISEHRESYDENNITDFLYGYMSEIDKNKNNSKSTIKEFVMEDMALLFFAAGSETTRNLLDWLLLIVAAYPDVQKKLQSEVDEVIGPDRLPTRSDRTRMLYTEAVIMETLRWRAHLPLNLPHRTLFDTEFQGYFIPKNTQIAVNFNDLLSDVTLWGNDAEDFKPERFLSPDGKEVLKPDYFVPFSIGKRSCPGESMAYLEGFVYLTAILQKFSLRLPEGVKPDLEAVTGPTLGTKPYKLCMEPRRN